MIGVAGQVALLRFPLTDLSKGKLRPVLVLSRIPGPYDDVLVCMMTSQLHHANERLDDRVRTSDDDFERSGLRVETLIRVGRLAVIETRLLQGVLGELAPGRVLAVRTRLARRLESQPD